MERVQMPGVIWDIRTLEKKKKDCSSEIRI